MFNYEKSGNGSGQRNEDDPNWGKFTLDACVDGDDRANFLPNRNKDWNFLCWQVTLDEIQLLDHTLVRLPNFVKANGDMHALVHRNRETSNKASDNKDSKFLMEKYISSLSSSIKNIRSVSMQREVNEWQ